MEMGKYTQNITTKVDKNANECPKESRQCGNKEKEEI